MNDGADVAGKASLSLVVCTFHREKLLGRALESVFAQNVAPGFDLEIVVVDNSDAATARATVTNLAAAAPFPLRFVEAHPPNISVARNAGVAAARGKAIAFLDDDQELAPGWLDAVGTALGDLPQDAFFGAVEPDFEAHARPTAMARQLFSRKHGAPRGAELVAFGPQKTRGMALATNNSIFRRAALPRDGRMFDLAFGNGGGEDYDLICRMQRAGARFGWLPDARAREFVPAARCAPAYLRRRFFAGGQAYAAAIANASERPGLARWSIRAKALVQLVLLAVRAPLAAVRGRDVLTDHLHLIAGALGKLSFAAISPIYRQSLPPAR
ncbi:MAG: glycosyltransferase family 2 protein [Rhodoblastus sp.]